MEAHMRLRWAAHPRCAALLLICVLSLPPP